MAPPVEMADTEMDVPGGAGRFLGAMGRLLGFCLLSGAALILFAAVLLLPEYARLQWARHELARQQAVNDDLNGLIAVNDRLIADLPNDPVLSKRLAMRQFGLRPADEVVISDGRAVSQPSAALVNVVQHSRPEEPSEWVLGAAERLSNPPKRRGLLLLAVAAMIAAIFLFPAREDRRIRPAAQESPAEQMSRD